MDLFRLDLNGWGSRLAWSGYVFASAIAIHQRSTRKPDLMLLVGTGVAWVGVTSTLRAFDILTGPRDSLMGLAVVVVLSLILVAPMSVLTPLVVTQGRLALGWRCRDVLRG